MIMMMVMVLIMIMMMVMVMIMIMMMVMIEIMMMMMFINMISKHSINNNSKINFVFIQTVRIQTLVRFFPYPWRDHKRTFQSSL